MPRRVAYAYLFLPLSLKLRGLSPCSHLINPLSFGIQVVNYLHIYARPITPDFFPVRGKTVWPRPCMTLTLQLVSWIIQTSLRSLYYPCLYRALAINVITVKHQNVVHPLSVDFRGLITSVWQKCGWFYSHLRNTSTLELTLLVCHSSL